MPKVVTRLGILLAKISTPGLMAIITILNYSMNQTSF